jgi:hypothetical protein
MGQNNFQNPSKNPVQLFRSWVYDEAGATVERATNRVGLLTALETKSLPHLSTSEAFQIVNYGIGGMYHPHHDFLVSHIFGWVLEIVPYLLPFQLLLLLHHTPMI